MPLKRKRSIKKKLTPFPSPTVWRKITSRMLQTGKYSTSKYLRSKKQRNKLKKNKLFLLQGEKQLLRIKQSTEKSIKSHVDRLALYRQTSVMKCDSFNAEKELEKRSHNSLAALPSLKNSLSLHKSSNVSCCGMYPPSMLRTTKRVPLVKKKSKRVKTQQKRKMPVENINSELLNEELKEIADSVQNFELKRKEFLSSLAKVQAQVSSLHLPKISLPKEIMDQNKKISKNENKQLKIENNKKQYESEKEITGDKNKPLKTKNKVVMKQRSLSKKSKPPNKKVSLPSNITGNNLMGNLAKMFTSSSRGLTAGGLTGGNALPGGLMNIAQTFCSMTSRL